MTTLQLATAAGCQNSKAQGSRVTGNCEVITPANRQRPAKLYPSKTHPETTRANA